MVEHLVLLVAIAAEWNLWDLDLGLDVGNLDVDVRDDGFLEKGLRFGRGQFLVGHHVLELMHRVDCSFVLWSARVTIASGRDEKGILHQA